MSEDGGQGRLLRLAELVGQSTHIHPMRPFKLREKVSFSYALKMREHGALANREAFDAKKDLPLPSI
ncbi:hypothetical protein GCM10009429_00780 [Dyella marensis]